MIIGFPHPPGSGGPGSFQTRFEKKITENGWSIEYAGDKADLIFVVGGTRRLTWLARMKRKGIPIVYRLDGINWLHRIKSVGITNFILSEYRNWNNKLLHAFFADHIVYQSTFSMQWWNKSGWRRKSNYSIIRNAVDTEEFRPIGESSSDTIALVCLEGTLDYTPYAVDLLNFLRLNLPENFQIKLYGRFENPINREKLHHKIKVLGAIARERVPRALNRCIYLSLDINPACPNTVIEALACGAPVVAFDTGALKELVPGNCGVVVPYGANPWKLGKPDMQSLLNAILTVRENYDAYSKAARSHAVNNLDVAFMFNAYVKVLNQVRR